LTHGETADAMEHGRRRLRILQHEVEDADDEMIFASNHRRPSNHSRRKAPPGALMLKLCLSAALMVALASGDALAQAFGSVHCKASLRQIEIDLKATQRKLQSTANAAAADKCSAMNVHVITLDRAAVIYGRCMEESVREENVGKAKASAADVRDQIAKTCG
jgi:hypothetical protein